MGILEPAVRIYHRNVVKHRAVWLTHYGLTCRINLDIITCRGSSDSIAQISFACLVSCQPIDALELQEALIS